MHHRIYLVKTPGGTYVANRPGRQGSVTSTLSSDERSKVRFPVPIPPQPDTAPDMTLLLLIAQRLDLLDEQRRWIERLGRSLVTAAMSSGPAFSGSDEANIPIAIAEALGSGTQSGDRIEFPAWLVEGLEDLPSSVDRADLFARLNTLRTEASGLDDDISAALKSDQS